MKTKKFVALGDTHFGWEYRDGVKTPIHNLRAIRATVDFIGDYEPDQICLMGDIIDCGEISHWNQKKKLSLEGLRLKDSLDLAYKEVFDPLSFVCNDLHYVFGNHEAWIYDVLEELPGLEGLVGVNEYLNLLGLGWNLYPLGTGIPLGKLLLHNGS